MEHIVLGRGNLGQALNRAIFRHTRLSPMVSYRESAEDLSKRFPDSEENWVWVTEGFGSVGECKQDPHGSFDLHVKRTHELIHRFPKSNLVFFSTNYVANESDITLSEYSISKALLEDVVSYSRRAKSNVWAIRVANIYSKYYPWNSFAGRLIKAINDGKTISLPANHMIPTDADWLANKLMSHHQSFAGCTAVIELAPAGSITTHRFGELVLKQILGKSLDNERPMYASLSSFYGDNETWIEVWNSAVEYRSSLNLPGITLEQTRY